MHVFLVKTVILLVINSFLDGNFAALIIVEKNLLKKKFQ